MAGFVEGLGRGQSSLFPAQIDDYMAEDNPVRAVDAFVDRLDLAKLGFTATEPLATGRPAYRPATMLKGYIYGYLNPIPSSRRRERECQRNIDLIWLTGKLAPDHKTIADFRKDNGKAIREVCRAFVQLCRQLDLLSEASVAIDGSKFKAVNARDNNFTQAKMKRRLEWIDESITRYMEQLVTEDRQIAGGNAAVPQAKVERLKDKIAKLNEEVARLNAINRQLQRSEDEQISLTDPDCRSMATSGKDTGTVGYKVQAAVDTKHHLIVAHEVTNVGSDRHQLADMAKKARAELGSEKLDVVADRGYYEGDEIKACEDVGISVTLPKPQTSGAKAEGRFGKPEQISLTDPDSRSMATSGKDSGIVGYNVQVAVDTEHHLIVAHEVTNVGTDRAQLANMGHQAKAVLGAHTLEAVADRGYYSGDEILACERSGISVTLPKPMKSGAALEGRYGKQDFVYLTKMPTGARQARSLPIVGQPTTRATFSGNTRPLRAATVRSRRNARRVKSVLSRDGSTRP